MSVSRLAPESNTPFAKRASIANWQFLAPVPHRRAALLIIADGTDRGTAMLTGFDRVDQIVVAGDSDCFSRARQFVASRHESNYACVAIPSAHRLCAPEAEQKFAALLGDVRDLLLSSGGVYVGCDALTSPESPRRRFAARHLLNRKHVHLLERAGFADIRPYYVDPSLLQPKNIVPATSRATSLWYYDLTPGSWNRIAKSRLASLGLHAALFRDRMVIACP